MIIVPDASLDYSRAGIPSILLMVQHVLEINGANAPLQHILRPSLSIVNDTHVQNLLVSDPCGCPSFVGPRSFDALR